MANQALTNKIPSDIENVGPLAFGVLVFFFFLLGLGSAVVPTSNAVVASNSCSTVLSAGLGSTTVTTYIESTAGIREGGRTGVTAITVSAFFLASLFFSPLLMSVPPWAVGPSLVLVGAMMMRVAKENDWGDMKEAIPAFVTMALMPLTFSIANGIIAGLAVYLALHLYDWASLAYGKVGKALDDRRNQVAAATPEVGPSPAQEV